MTGRDLIVVLKKYPLSAGCVAASIALAAAIYFRSDEIPTAEAALAEKTALAERYELNLKYSAQLKEQLEELVAANKVIDSRVLRASQIGVNSGYFYKLFTETGVKQLDFRQTTATTITVPKGAKSDFVPVAFSVSVQGTMAQVMDFLRRLEGGEHYCRVLTATCSSNTANRGGGLLSLALTLEIFGRP